MITVINNFSYTGKLRQLIPDKMKKTLTYSLLTCLLILSATALQAQSTEKGDIQGNADITVSINEISLQGDSLLIDMMIYAKDIRINSDQSLRLDLSLESSEVKASLPSVLYTGSKRLRYDNRIEKLSGKEVNPGTYHTFAGISKDKSYPLHYSLKVTYNEWMNDATIRSSRVYHDCCDRHISGQEVLAQLNLVPKIIPVAEPEIWKPDPAVYRQMISFLTPEVETVKNRIATVSANIDYPRSIYQVRPEFGRNPQELIKVDSLMKSIMDNELISIGSLHITGYASPEGTYKSNELLAKRRSLGFKDYLKKNYKLGKTPIHNDWIAEDWNGLVQSINKREMSYKQEILDIINSADIFDFREKKLMQLAAGHPYREMLDELFPSLRRIELRADYVVSKASELQAKELLYTRPDLLNLNEIYRVALFYTPGTIQYSDVYNIAVKQYPNDIIANNNAAAVLLMEGKTKEARTYLNKIKSDARTYINLGAAAYIDGKHEEAAAWFEKAAANGDTQAQESIKLMEKR